MSSALSVFCWHGQPSEIGKSLMKTQRAPKKPPTPITFRKQGMGASINTDTMLPADKTRLIYRGNAR